ncbi:MAG: hypothetical protein CMN72_00410 [Sphingomonas sp.]|mgnify:CR=1 FL=1|nr:hypothetical protein [Sphingomonas sp.]|tara:strand:+ start:369 stop:863 length:495 start_codon:yes stop_codon:yes gene_type:complete
MNKNLKLVTQAMMQAEAFVAKSKELRADLFAVKDLEDLSVEAYAKASDLGFEASGELYDAFLELEGAIITTSRLRDDSLVDGDLDYDDLMHIESHMTNVNSAFNLIQDTGTVITNNISERNDPEEFDKLVAEISKELPDIRSNIASVNKVSKRVMAREHDGLEM